MKIIKGFTWRRKNPEKKQSMLDIFSINDEIFQFVYATSIIPCYRTYHSEISLNLKVQYNGRGKGYWKFNYTL